MNMIKQEWDSFWKNNDYPLIRRLSYNLERNAIKKVVNKLVKDFGLNKDIQVLDVGCGEGRSLEWLRYAGLNNVIGIDNSKSAIQRCKMRGLEENKDVFLKDILKDDIFSEEYTFSMIFSEGALEHYEDMEPLVERMTEVAREYIFLVQPLYDSIVFRFLDWIHKTFGKFRDYVKENPYKIKDYLEVFEKYNFVLGNNLL